MEENAGTGRGTERRTIMWERTQDQTAEQNAGPDRGTERMTFGPGTGCLLGKTGRTRSRKKRRDGATLENDAKS